MQAGQGSRGPGQLTQAMAQVTAPGCPAARGNSRPAWAAGEQAFSVRAAHQALKHVLSVFWGWSLIVTPQGPVTTGYPPSHTPILYPHPSSPSSRGRDPCRPGCKPAVFFFNLKDLVHPSLGRAPGKASGSIHPFFPFPTPSEMNLVGVLPSQNPECKPPPRGCPRRVGVGLAPSVAPNPSSPYTLHSGIRHSPPRPTPPL